MSIDYQTPWSGQAALGGKAIRVVVGINSSAGPAVYYRLEIFYIGIDYKLYHRWQDPKQPHGWGGPALLAGEAASIAVTNLTDGNLAVFYTDAKATLHYTWQDPKKPGGWGGPTVLGEQAANIAVTSNGGGGLELFYSGGANLNLYHQSQSQSDGAWSPAQAIGPTINTLAATRNVDGNPVIAYADHHNLYTLLALPGQQPVVLASYLSAPPSVGSGSIALTSYASGGLALFYIGDSFKIYHYYQVAFNAPWTQQTLPATARNITAVRMVDDTLALLFADINDTLYYSWPQAQQDGSLQWSPPVLLGGTANAGRSLSAALNADGRLEIFYTGEDTSLNHNWQVNNWQTLQNVPQSAIKSQSCPDSKSLPATVLQDKSFGLFDSSTQSGPSSIQLGPVTWLKVHWLDFTDGSCKLMYIEWLIGQAGGGSISQHTGFIHDVTPRSFTVMETAFAFQENERLNACTLYAQGSDDVVGIYFVTSLGHSFTVGNQDYLAKSTAVQLSEVAGAVLMGFYGNQRNDTSIDETQTIPYITWLGLWITNSVKSISVQNIRYDLGRATITNQQVQSLMTTELVNDSGVSQSVSQSMNYTLTNSSNWSHTETDKIGVSVDVSYTIPVIDVGLKFTVSYEHTWEQSTGGGFSQSTSYTYTASDTVLAHSKVNVDVTSTQAVLSVPYVADVIVTYTNGTTVRLNTSPGVYSGVQNYDIRATYTTPAGTSVQRVTTA